MSTRAAIIMYDENKDHYYGIYCHNDGYPEYMLKMLQNNYDTFEKVKALIELGDLSVVKSRVEPDDCSLHTFYDPQIDVTIAYNRDRGEDYNPPCEGKTWENVASNIDHSYVYVFKDNKWNVYNTGRHLRPEQEWSK